MHHKHEYAIKAIDDSIVVEQCTKCYKIRKENTTEQYKALWSYV